jgi:hypothetical protein
MRPTDQELIEALTAGLHCAKEGKHELYSILIRDVLERMKDRHKASEEVQKAAEKGFEGITGGKKL